jgi:hypothetical protein
LVILGECKACIPFHTVSPDEPWSRTSFWTIECARRFCPRGEPGRVPCW